MRTIPWAESRPAVDNVVMASNRPTSGVRRYSRCHAFDLSNQSGHIGNIGERRVGMVVQITIHIAGERKVEAVVEEFDQVALGLREAEASHDGLRREGPLECLLQTLRVVAHLARLAFRPACSAELRFSQPGRASSPPAGRRDLGPTRISPLHASSLQFLQPVAYSRRSACRAATCTVPFAVVSGSKLGSCLSAAQNSSIVPSCCA